MRNRFENYRSTKLDEHLSYIKSLRDSLATQSLENQIDTLKKIYTYIREINSEFYIKEEGYVDSDYDSILKCLEECEKKLPPIFIASPEKPFNFSKRIKNSDTTPEAIMDYLVYKTRIQLRNRLFKKSNENFENLDLQNYCLSSANTVAFFCFIKGIKQKKYKIEPGFKKHSDLYNGGGLHFFNIVTIEDRQFLIDCTYSQFFLLRRCLKDRIGLMYWPITAPGAFMADGSRKYVRDIILERGWIELDDTVLKDYLDGFALSYRNGLYYEETGDFSYTTPYSTEDYKNFLKNTDSQETHEGKVHLGYQCRPLKNPHIEF